MSLAKINQRSTFKMVVVVVAMFGFGYLLVPLYDVFCELTGLNGKTGEISEAEVTKSFEIDENRLVTIQFVTSNNVGMPWKFAPSVSSMEVHPGKVYETSFMAKNITSADMVAQAVPSVSPSAAARYFNKTECFCFNQQPLAAGETKDMPLRFIVNPKLPKKVNTLTLAYTMFDVTPKITK